MLVEDHLPVVVCIQAAVSVDAGMQDKHARGLSQLDLDDPAGIGRFELALHAQ